MGFIELDKSIRDRFGQTEHFFFMGNVNFHKTSFLSFLGPSLEERTSSKKSLILALLWSYISL